MTAPSGFSADVHAVIGPLLGDLGFTLDEIDDSPDEGGRERHIVYYRSNDCKIQVFDSWREGDVNCMIAPADVPNQFGPEAEKWQFLTRFAELPDLSLSEISDLAKGALDAYPNRLEWVRHRIAKYYDAAHEGVLALYGEGYSL
jgi:hypothetical protein